MQNDKRSLEQPAHLSTVEARSGSRTHVTRNILFISLALVILAFIIALATGFFQTSKTGADTVTPDNAAQSMQNASNE